MTSAQPAQGPLARSDMRRRRGLFKELIYFQLILGILNFFSQNKQYREKLNTCIISGYVTVQHQSIFRA